MLNKDQLHSKYLGDTTSEGFRKEALCEGQFKREHDDLQYIGSALKVVSGTWLDIERTIGRVSKNTALTSGERLMATADAVGRKRNEVMELVDVIRQRATKQQAHIAGLVKTTVKPPPGTEGIVPEVRAHLRSLNEAQRSRLLNTTKGDDALTLMHAVASAPAFLSGVVEGKRMEMRGTLIAVYRPELFELEGGVAEGLALLDKASARFNDLVNDHVDFESAAELRKLGEVT